MRTPAIALAVAGLAGATAGAGAGDAPVLQPGAYEVRVRLELPHVEDADHATRVERLCIAAGGAPTRGLAVLSNDNPLRQCPVSGVRYDGAILTFDIVCPGGDAAVGAAKYTLWAERFEGAIAVKAGGKNMTMIERQSGRRIGTCTPEPPRS